MINSIEILRRAVCLISVNEVAISDKSNSA